MISEWNLIQRMALDEKIGSDIADRIRLEKDIKKARKKKKRLEEERRRDENEHLRD